METCPPKNLVTKKNETLFIGWTSTIPEEKNCWYIFSQYTVFPAVHGGVGPYATITNVVLLTQGDK